MESCDWAGMLLRMYNGGLSGASSRSRDRGRPAGDQAGVTSATSSSRAKRLRVAQDRMRRASAGPDPPFDSNARRHTSVRAVDVVPASTTDIDIESTRAIAASTCTAPREAGGQDVNNTEFGRPGHPHPDRHRGRLPGGALAAQEPARPHGTCFGRGSTSGSSRAREARGEQGGRKTEIGWGHQIRSYVLQPYQMVKDLRTGHVSSSPADVLDGDLDPFMEASLAQRLSGRTVVVEDVE